MSTRTSLHFPDSVKKQFEPICNQLTAVRHALSRNGDVLSVRPGFSLVEGENAIPAIVVAVRPGTHSIDLECLSKQFGVHLELTDATIEEQLRSLQPVSFAGRPQSNPFESYLLDETMPDFAPPRKGAYEPLDPPVLPLVEEVMKATICVSPEAGWSNLEAFLKGTKRGLKMAMYQFTAPHIFEAFMEAVGDDPLTLELVLHPRPEAPPRTGVKSNDLDEVEQVLKPLKAKMGDRFKFSWATLNSRATPDGLWASAYHIKVIVRDQNSFWVSSGNNQTSNLPNFHLFPPSGVKPPAGFQSNYNRDYHAIIENLTLAHSFETYINRDYEQTRNGQPEGSELPDLFVSETEPKDEVTFAGPPQFFPPLRLDRKIKVQPLLTPDNYAEHVIRLIDSAKTSIFFQNQYINMRGTDENFPELKRLVGGLKQKLDDGLDVRIICRDMMKQESLDVLLGLGFPRRCFRFQKACHNKTIIVDKETVMFGSHNWSNEGVATNRDASLIFFDREIAEYLTEIYEYDWTRLATAKPMASRPRVAQPGESAPVGMRRVPFSAVFEDDGVSAF